MLRSKLLCRISNACVPTNCLVRKSLQIIRKASQTDPGTVSRADIDYLRFSVSSSSISSEKCPIADQSMQYGGSAGTLRVTGASRRLGLLAVESAYPDGVGVLALVCKLSENC